MTDNASNKKSVEATRYLMGQPVDRVVARLVGGDVRAQETAKKAILVAQAAEVTQRLAEKAEAVIMVTERAVAQKKFVSENFVIAHSDPLFQSVGSDRDAKVLQYAQGTRMAAQMFYNNEVAAANDAVLYSQIGACRGGEPALPSRSLGTSSVNGFKRAASELYFVASELLAKEGYGEASALLRDVSLSLAKTMGKGLAPVDTVRRMAANLLEDRMDLAWALGDNGVLQKDSLEDAYDKLERLTGLYSSEDAGRPDYVREQKQRCFVR